MRNEKLERIGHREISERRRSAMYAVGLALAILATVIALVVAARSILLAM
jgi:hypothetical protein